MFPLNAQEEEAILALLTGRVVSDAMVGLIVKIRERMLEREEYRRFTDQAARDRA